MLGGTVFCAGAVCLDLYGQPGHLVVVVRPLGDYPAGGRQLGLFGQRIVAQVNALGVLKLIG